MHISLPVNYLVLDLEADGLDREQSLVFQIGLVRVQNCQVQLLDGAETSTCMVDWTREPGIDPHLWEQRLVKVRPLFERPDGFPSVPLLQAQGLAPREAFRDLDTILQGCTAAGQPPIYLAGHNIRSYDRPLLLAQYRRLGMIPPPVLLNDRQIVDTLHLEPRGRGSRRLRDLCEGYGLIKAGEEQRWHEAGFDALVTYRLLEKQRSLRGGLRHGETGGRRAG